MRTVNRIFITTISAAAVFGLSGITAAAHAAEPNSHPFGAELTAGVTAAADTPTENSMQALITRWFNVVNGSSSPMTITGYFWGNIDGSGEVTTPAVGTVITPGQSLMFQVPQWFIGNQRLTVHFSTDYGPYDVRFEVTPLGEMSVISIKGATPIADSWTRDTITIGDANDKVIEVPASDTQTQADVLTKYCENASAVCSFTPTSQEHIETNPKVVKVYPNNGPVEQSFSLKYNHTASETDNVEVSASVKANILKLVEASINAKYAHSWAQSSSWEVNYPFTVPAYYKVVVSSTDMMLRTTGEFTVKIGRTTWKLHGVYFDTPAPDSTGPNLVPDFVPLTKVEREALPLSLSVVDNPTGVDVDPSQATPVTAED